MIFRRLIGTNDSSCKTGWPRKEMATEKNEAQSLAQNEDSER